MRGRLDARGGSNQTATRGERCGQNLIAPPPKQPAPAASDLGVAHPISVFVHLVLLVAL